MYDNLRNKQPISTPRFDGPVVCNVDTNLVVGLNQNKIFIIYIFMRIMYFSKPSQVNLIMMK